MNVRNLQRETRAIAKCACEGCPNDADYGEGAFLGFCGPCLGEAPDLEEFAEEFALHLCGGRPLKRCNHGL